MLDKMADKCLRVVVSPKKKKNINLMKTAEDFFKQNNFISELKQELRRNMPKSSKEVKRIPLSANLSRDQQVSQKMEDDRRVEG